MQMQKKVYREEERIIINSFYADSKFFYAVNNIQIEKIQVG